jgi:arylsulfatase
MNITFLQRQAVHRGGESDMMLVHWPDKIGVEGAGQSRTQYTHIIDIAPTVYEAASVEPPAAVDGVTQQPIHGKSFAYALEPNSADEPSKRTRQYYEMYGNMVRADGVECGGVSRRL